MTSLSRRRFIRILAGTGALLCPLSGVRAFGAHTVYWSGQALGAKAEMKLLIEDKRLGNHLVAAALNEISRLEKILSLYQPDSAIRRLNSQGFLDQPPKELVTLIQDSIKLSTLSNGAFDITVQPLWQYLYYLDGERPDPKRIEQLASRTGYQAIHCSNQRIWFSKPGMQITLNGIAQGFITDRVTELLRNLGLENALIELGETFALGRNASYQPWQIGVKRPDRGGIAATLALGNKALATSAGYGTDMGAAGSYHHILDARSATSPKLFGSISVVAPNATWADGLSTTLFLLEKDKHLGVLQHYPESYCLDLPLPH